MNTYIPFYYSAVRMLSIWNIERPNECKLKEC